MSEKTQTKTASKRAEKLRKFLVGHANINGGKAVIFFFKKSGKTGQPMGPPVKVSLKKMAVVKENFQHGHSVYAKNLTASFCEKVLKLSEDLELNVFFSVPALVKNTRKHDDITGLGCAFLDDVPANLFSEDMLSKGMVLPNFSFPVSTIIQTSPGNCQVLWNFKGFLPIDERYKGPQPSFLPADPKHRKDLFNRMLGLLKKRLEGDPGGSNLNQIYRLPFTRNYKYSPAPEVELLHSDFSPSNRINFGEFYTKLLSPEIEKHYQDKFADIFLKVRKNNDWILIENLLGWGESADDIGRSWTANERDLSAAGRLMDQYNASGNMIKKILLSSPNRQKGQDKGEQYFDSLFKKLETFPQEKIEGPLSVRRRTTFDLLRVFGEAAALLFSRRPKVIIDIPVDGGKIKISRSGGGMTRQRARVLMWGLSEAMVWLNDEGTRVHLKRIIDTPFDDFAKDVMGINEKDFDSRRRYLMRAYRDFDRLHEPMVSLRFVVGKYYDLSSGSRGISPFTEFKRTEDDRVIIEISPEMEEALNDPVRLKRISNKFLSFIDRAEEALTPPLLLWIGETFYDKKNANTEVVISSEELIKRLQGPRKVSNNYAKRFRDRVYKSVKEINNNNLLELIGTSARKIDVSSNREATEFKFKASQFSDENQAKLGLK